MPPRRPRKPPGHDRGTEGKIGGWIDRSMGSGARGSTVEEKVGMGVQQESKTIVQNPFKLGQQYTTIGPKLVPGGGNWEPSRP